MFVCFSLLLFQPVFFFFFWGARFWFGLVWFGLLVCLVVCCFCFHEVCARLSSIKQALVLLLVFTAGLRACVFVRTIAPVGGFVVPPPLTQLFGFLPRYSVCCLGHGCEHSVFFSLLQSPPPDFVLFPTQHRSKTPLHFPSFCQPGVVCVQGRWEVPRERCEAQRHWCR